MKFILYSPLLVIIFVILIIVYCFHKRLVLFRMFYGSMQITKRLGIIVAVSGMVRSGKSTLTAGLTHLYTFKIRGDLQDTIHEIEIILKEINFVNLLSLVNMMHFNLDNFDEQFNLLIGNFIQKSNYGYVFTHKLDEKFFDYLNYQNKITLLKDYILSYLYLNRSSYVFSNIRMFNHITKSYALEFDNDWIKLKNNNDFPLLPYSIFVEDDKLIYDSNIGYLKKLSEDNGSDLFYRLFGHLFKEKSIYICTLQDVSRWIKLEREIAQNHIFVFKSSVIGNFPILNKFINFFDKFINWLYSVLQKFYKNERYFNNNNRFKNIFYKILMFRKKLFSKAFVHYETAVYSDIEKVGSEIKEEDRSSYYFDFVLPVPYVFGSLNTHEFYALYKYLYGRSKLKFTDLKEMEFNEDEVLDILKKYNDPGSTNVSMSNSSDNLDGVF